MTAITEDGEVELWKGRDPVSTLKKRGVAKVKIENPIPTKVLKIYLKSADVSGYNEIDAVGIVEEDGSIYWATEATASSTYVEQ